MRGKSTGGGGADGALSGDSAGNSGMSSGRLSLVSGRELNGQKGIKW